MKCGDATDLGTRGSQVGGGVEGSEDDPASCDGAAGVPGLEVDSLDGRVDLGAVRRASSTRCNDGTALEDGPDGPGCRGDAITEDLDSPEVAGTAEAEDHTVATVSPPVRVPVVLEGPAVAVHSGLLGVDLLDGHLGRDLGHRSCRCRCRCDRRNDHCACPENCGCDSGAEHMNALLLTPPPDWQGLYFYYNTILHQ